MSQETLNRIAGWCEAEPDLELDGSTLTVDGRPPLVLTIDVGDEALTLSHLHAVEDPPHGFADAAVQLLSHRASMVRGEVVTGTDRTQARVRYPIYLEGLNRQSFLVGIREMVAAVEALDRLAATGESADAGGSRAAPPPREPEHARPAEAQAARPAAAQPAARAWAPSHVVPATGMAAWGQPDPAQQPVANLAPGVQLQIEEQRGAWARVTGSNGWQGWVDGRILQPMGAAGAAVQPAAARPAAGGAAMSVHAPAGMLGGIMMIAATFLAWGDWTYAKALDVSVAAVYPLSESVTWSQPKIGMLLLAAGALAVIASLIPAINPGLRILSGIVGVVLGLGVLLSFLIVASVPFGDLFDHRLTGTFVALAGGIVAMLPANR